MKRPNFFIVGAPKCGTTSLAKWLGEHSQIFMSNPKEIYFFDTDQSIGNVKSLKQYLHIFRGAQDKHLAVGEASVTYLSSKVAVTNILAFDLGAKFIVMLRNPIEMVQSLHHELLWDGWECIEDFEIAWRSRNVRELGKGKSGKQCTYLPFLQYEDMCKLGEQVERLMQAVEEQNLLFIVMDDLMTNSLYEYKRTLEFLGVPYNENVDIKAENSRKIARNSFFRNITIHLFKIKQWFGLSFFSFGVLNALDQINKTKNKVSPIRPELKQELVDVFREDVKKLSDILGRDFSHWLEK
jgi:Sulfotransferase domain